jgi:hypothetical protein
VSNFCISNLMAGCFFHRSLLSPQSPVHSKLPLPKSIAEKINTWVMHVCLETGGLGIGGTNGSGMSAHQGLRSFTRRMPLLRVSKGE